MIPDADTLRRVMTRSDVARYLGVSTGTVYNMHGIDLHPWRVGNAWVYESEEVEKLGAKRAKRAPTAQSAKMGELAARAFDAFDANTPFKDVVKALKVKPEIVMAWYVAWRTPIEEAYARVVADKKAHAAQKRARALERMGKEDRRQDKHDLQKFKQEMDVINKTLKGKKP